MNIADKYFNELENKQQELENDVEELDKKINTDPEVHFVIKQKKSYCDSHKDKLNNFYNCLIKKVPLQYQKELSDYLSPFYLNSDNVKYYFNKYSKPLVKNGFDAEYFKFSVFKGISKKEIIEKVSSYIPEKDLQEAIEENENFIGKKLNKQKVKLLEDKVNNAKEYLETNEHDENKKKEILKELDLINNLVIGTNEEYRNTIDNRDPEFETGRNKLCYISVNNYINKNNPSSKKFINILESAGAYLNEDVVNENIEEFKKVKSEIKYTLSDKHKKSTIKILKAFEKMGIYDPIDNGNEQGTKVYGFRQIFNAHVAIEKALDNNDFSKLKELRENYQIAINNMNELFKIVKDEFDPNPKTMVGNLSNLRHSYVPYDFVDDIATNATVSGLYNTLTVIKTIGCTPEEFVEDPYKYLNDYRNTIKNNNLNIDTKAQGKSLPEVLSYAFFNKFYQDINDNYGSATLLRISEGLRNRENDEEKRDDLFYNSMLNYAVDSIVTTYATGGRERKSYYASHYLRNNPSGTIANALLVNDEDRVYSKLRAYEHYDINDDLTIIQPFDVKDYILSHNIDAVELANRIKETTTALYRSSQENLARLKNIKENQIQMISGHPEEEIPEIINNFIKGSQKAIELYMLLKNPSLEDKGIADLMALLKDPFKMLDGVELDETTTKNLNALKNADKSLSTAEKASKKLGKTIIKNERKAEKTFNKQALKIMKDIAKLEAKGLDATEKQNELAELKNQESQRIESKVKSNMLPKDYFDKRIQMMNNNEFKNKAQLFDDGIPSKKDYIKTTGLDGLSKAEINGLYDSFKLRIKHEKTVFVNGAHLIEKKSVPATDVFKKEQLNNNVIENKNIKNENIENENNQEIQQQNIAKEKVSIPLDEIQEIDNEEQDIDGITQVRNIDKSNNLDI